MKYITFWLWELVLYLFQCLGLITGHEATEPFSPTPLLEKILAFMAPPWQADHFIRGPPYTP